MTSPATGPTRRNPVARAVVLLLASVNAALALIVTSQWSGYASSVLTIGVALVLAALAGIYVRRWAAFAYAGWSILAAFWAVALYLGLVTDFEPGSTRWVVDLAGWSIWLSLIGVVVGIVVGLVLGGKPPAKAPPA